MHGQLPLQVKTFSVSVNCKRNYKKRVLGDRDSEVSLETRLRVERVRIPAEAEHLPVLRNVQTGTGAPPSLLHIGYQGTVSLGINRPRREANHSPLPSVEVKNEWLYTSNLPISRHGVYRDNFTLKGHHGLSVVALPFPLRSNRHDTDRQLRPVSSIALCHAVMTRDIIGKALK